MWKKQTRYTLDLIGEDAIGFKSAHLIPQKWENGYMVEVQILDNDPQQPIGRKKIFQRWFYESRDIPNMATWLEGLVLDKIQGNIAEYCIFLIFQEILDKYQDVKDVFIEHFPNTFVNE